jgi:hypothetical protein
MQTSMIIDNQAFVSTWDNCMVRLSEDELSIKVHKLLQTSGKIRFMSVKEIWLKGITGGEEMV